MLLRIWVGCSFGFGNKILELFSCSHEKNVFSYVYVWGGGVEYVHMSAGPHGGQKRASSFLALELQVSKPVRSA